jgi:hypothetical protein
MKQISSFFYKLSDLIDDFKKPVNLEAFLILRIIAFIGLLFAEAVFFIAGSPLPELFFFFIIISLWFLFGFAVEFFIPSFRTVSILRCALFAMVDVYLIVSLFIYTGNAVMPALFPFAGYIILSCISAGIFVGLFVFISGIIAFVQGYAAQISFDVYDLLTAVGIGLLSLTGSVFFRLFLINIEKKKQVSEHKIAEKKRKVEKVVSKTADTTEEKKPAARAEAETVGNSARKQADSADKKSAKKDADGTNEKVKGKDKKPVPKQKKEESKENKPSKNSKQTNQDDKHPSKKDLEKKKNKKAKSDNKPDAEPKQEKNT